MNGWLPRSCWEKKYNEKADVFSYGMVLVELITRKKPPKRLPGKAFAFELDKLKSLAPPSCPPGFIEIVNECAIWDPEKRPSLKEVLPRLKALEKTLPEDEGEKSSEKISQGQMTIEVEEGSDDSESGSGSSQAGTGEGSK